MNTYEKPVVELICFETENLLDDDSGDVGVTPDTSIGLEPWAL